MNALKNGDRVKIKGGSRVFYVVEIDVPGAIPIPPSTTVIRMALPPDFKLDYFQYGDALLEPAPE